MSTLQLWDNPLAFVAILVSIPLLLITVAWLTGKARNMLSGGIEVNPVVENLPLKENRGR